MAKSKNSTVDNVTLTFTSILGRNFIFCTDTDGDTVQSCMRRGVFYEQEELTMLRSIFPIGGCFVDIGANVGNHSLFAAAFFAPREIIGIEPNPRAIRLLNANVKINGFTHLVDLTHVGVGFSNDSSSGFGMERKGKKLGSLRMLPGNGNLNVVTGDSVLIQSKPDLIKIDVEGMEMLVLSGLTDTIERCRPHIFVEVGNLNRAAFINFLSEIDYHILDTFEQNSDNKNYLVSSNRGS
jgi:FkbM family methyltransferase